MESYIYLVSHTPEQNFLDSAEFLSDQMEGTNAQKSWVLFLLSRSFYQLARKIILKCVLNNFCIAFHALDLVNNISYIHIYLS